MTAVAHWHEEVDSATAGSVARDQDTWTRTAATVILGLAGIASWWPVLGAGLLWSLPMLVLAALVAGRVVTAPEGWRAPVAWVPVVWIPFALMIGGLSASVLSPTELWGTTHTVVRTLLLDLRDPASSGPWLLASWLAGSGTCWFLGALQSIQRGRLGAAIAFFLLAFPFASAIAFRRVDDAAWHGAIVLVAALFWTTRGDLWSALPAVAAIAIVAVVSAVAVGPTEQWDAFKGANAASDFTRLDTRQTYGPEGQKRTGATMLEITADRPDLWRMQVLDWFDGRGWATGSGDGDEPLPEPAATKTQTTVRVRGLRDAYVVAPGQVQTVSAAGRNGPGVGASYVLDPTPRSGDTYTVESTVVRPSAADLLRVAIPQANAYPKYTQTWVSPTGRSAATPAAAVADTLTPTAAATQYGQVLALARRLSKGETSQVKVVGNVLNYLDGGGRFRYSTKVRQPGAQPLVDFLLTTHVGYCQHFAGAAALLLRLSGVPARVVTGFGTGIQTGDNTYRVRDEEAHAWVEVYFEGLGWVTVDPTPPATETEVAAGAATITTNDGGGSGGSGGAETADAKAGRHAVSGGTKPIAVGLLALLVVAAVIVSRRRRKLSGLELPPPAVGDLLLRLVPAPSGPDTTLRDMRVDLARIGPATVALAEESERRRFGPKDLPPEPHPYRRVWGALRQDVGVARAIALLVGGPGRRATPASGDAPQPLHSAAGSVAPPPRS